MRQAHEIIRSSKIYRQLLIMNHDLKAVYDRIAGDWNEEHKNDAWWTSGAEKFCSYLKAGDHVLDVGCAGGRKTDYLSKKGFVAMGIDFSDGMIAIAKKSFPNLPFFVKDITMPLDLGGKFDGIFAQAVILHVPKNETKGVLARLVSLLNPRGYIYIAVKGMVPGRQKEEMMIKENGYGYAYERFFSFYSHDELQKYFTDLGLSVVFSDRSTIGKTEWLQVIACKP